MVDRISPKTRSILMSRIRSKGSSAELSVRTAFHRAGLRFRLHRKDLPGTPDVVLPRLQATVFVNGCFWHGHSCKRGNLPASNVEFWSKKIDRNRARDRDALAKLHELGWRTFTIWECQLESDTAAVIEALQFIRDPKAR